MKQEMSMLCSWHGIGIIELNIKEPSKSIIRHYASEKKDVDLNMMNRLAVENLNFRKYLTLIAQFCKINKIYSADWD